MFPWFVQMDPTWPLFVGFTNGASRWYPNLTSNAWVIYSLSHELIHIEEMFVGVATINQTEYIGVIGLLIAALQLGIRHLDVFLDSQLNNYNRVHDPCLFRRFLCTRHLVRHFESILFMHVPRSQ